MKARIRNKIRERMLDIDEMLALVVPLYHQQGGWQNPYNEWGPTVNFLRSKIRKLKGRWPRIYYATFFWGDFA